MLCLDSFERAHGTAVDGMPGEWSGPAITFNNPVENYREEIRTAIASGQLYLMAKVRGDVPGHNPRTGNGLWNGDCLELYFTPAAAGRAVGYYRETDFHVGLALGVDGRTAHIANLLAGSPPEIPGATGRYRQIPGGGYDLEAAIPLAFFWVGTVKAGDRFGFDLQLGVGNSQTPDRAVADHPGPVYAYRFTKNSATIYAVWAAETAERHEITLPVTTPTVFRRISLFGDESTVTVAPGTPLALPANHDPILL